jgi:two-component system, NarL family, response regulator NreC
VCPPTHMHYEASTTPGKIRCVLVHDHVWIRQGLRRLLEDEPALEIVAEASNVAEALQKVVDCRPEVVLADAHNLKLAASEAEQLFLRESPESKVVFLSLPEEEGFVDHVGLAGCAARQTSGEELIQMIRRVCQDRWPAAREMSEGDSAERNGTAGQSPRRHVLTAREHEVLKLLAEGSTVRSAARVLGLSVKTVDAHKFNLMRKLRIHNKAELVMWAIRKQVVKIPANR